MPNWKKVIVSGSNAVLNSLNVTNGITGSLLGTSSYATQALTASNANTSSYVVLAQTASYVLNAVSASFASTASFVPTSSLVGNFFVQGGNSFGAQALLGTNDNQNLALETSGSVRMFISSSGLVGINTTTPANTLDVSGSARINGSITFATDGSGGNGLSFTRNSSNNWTWATSGIGNVMTISGNNIGLPQVVTTSNGLNATPGGNATTYALRTTVGAYPSAILASFTSGSVTVLSISGSGMVGTGSFNYLGSITATSFTGSLQGTASYATQALSASYALNASTASYFNGTSLTISQSLTINQNTASLASGTQTISTNSTGSYTSAFYKYTLASGSNARAGQVMAVWNGANIQYTDVATNDIGTTSNVALTASLSGGNVLLTSTLPSSGWTVKTLVNLL